MNNHSIDSGILLADTESNLYKQIKSCMIYKFEIDDKLNDNDNVNINLTSQYVPVVGHDTYYNSNSIYNQKISEQIFSKEENQIYFLNKKLR